MGLQPFATIAGSFAAFALKCFVALALLAPFLPAPARAACTGVVAGDGARLWHAAAGEKAASLTYLGHASFLIESPGGVRIVTDYNDVHPGAGDARHRDDEQRASDALHRHHRARRQIRAARLGPGRRGGEPQSAIPRRRVNNVPTNVRGFGETRYNGNSIFVFDLADLCIAHLGHLHHTLTEAHLAEIGTIDIVLVPVDGSFTLNQPEMIEVLRQLKAKIAIPMHVFTEETLARFLARAAGARVRRAARARAAHHRDAVRPAGNAGDPGIAGAVSLFDRETGSTSLRGGRRLDAKQSRLGQSWRCCRQRGLLRFARNDIRKTAEAGDCRTSVADRPGDSCRWLLVADGTCGLGICLRARCACGRDVGDVERVRGGTREMAGIERSWSA